MLLVAALIAGTLAAVPESVLRGMNLGYRRMGWQAGIHVAGGLFTVAALWAGLGLGGVAGAQVLRFVVAGLCFLLLARACVPWFGADRPQRSEISTVLGMSAWLTAGDVIAKLVLASDVVILGAVVAPDVVTGYVLTGYAARTAIGVHVFTSGAAIPGLGGLIGEGERERAARAHRELVLLTWLFATVAGTGILFANRAFLARWVGPGHYAGSWMDLLIVLVAVQTAFIRTDAYVIDAALRPRPRVIAGIAAAIFTIGGGIALTRTFGPIGVCLALLAGRAVQSIAYPRIVRASLGACADRSWRWLRLGAVTAALFAAALALGQRWQPAGWVAWATGATGAALTATLLALAFGTSAEDRHALRRRLGALRGARA
jgi:O-antigen/teichoic acid export membrane protein